MIMELPVKLSDWISIALRCEARAHASNKYNIDLEKFHYYDKENDVCHVCLAGATAAFKLKLNRTETTYPFQLDSGVRKYIRALDDLNFGHIRSALEEVGVKDVPESLKINEKMSKDRTSWRDDIRSIGKKLKEAGL